MTKTESAVRKGTKMTVVYEFKRKEFIALVDSMISTPADGCHDAEVYAAVRLAIIDMARSAHKSHLHSRVVQIKAAESEQPGCRCNPCHCGQNAD